MSKIAIFASGNGSNAARLIQYLGEKGTNVRIATIYTNRREAGIYDVAAKYGMPIKYFTNLEFQEGEKVLTSLQSDKIDWIVLAGFLRKVEELILTAYDNRIINIHPSLLPKFGGKGMYGNRVHEAVIAAGEKESGISIHLVNAEFDKGEILFQAKCSVKKGQTVEELRKKIQNLEHHYFPEVVVKTIKKAQNQ